MGLGLAARGSVTDTADWARRAEDLGLDSIWVHDSYFERDPITYLTAMGVPDRVVMEILGHSDITMTMNTYTHVLPEMQRAAASRMEEFLASAR